MKSSNPEVKITGSKKIDEDNIEITCGKEVYNLSLIIQLDKILKIDLKNLSNKRRYSARKSFEDFVNDSIFKISEEISEIKEGMFNIITEKQDLYLREQSDSLVLKFTATFLKKVSVSEITLNFFSEAPVQPNSQMLDQIGSFNTQINALKKQNKNMESELEQLRKSIAALEKEVSSGAGNNKKSQETSLLPSLVPEDLIKIKLFEKKFSYAEMANYSSKKTLNGHTKCVTCVIFIKWDIDNETILSGGYDNQIRIWNINTGDCLKVLTGHSNYVNCLCQIRAEANKSTVVSGSGDCTIKIWNLETRVCTRTINAHTDIVYSIIHIKGIRNKKVIASSSADNSVKLFNIEKGENLMTLSEHSSSVRSLVLLKNVQGLSCFASGSYDKTIKIWDINNQNSLATLEGHTSYVRVLAFIKHVSFNLLSGSGDRSIKLWNTLTGECLKTLRFNNDWVGAISTYKHRTGNCFILCGGGDKKIRIIDLDNELVAGVLSSHTDWIGQVFQIKSNKEYPYHIVSCSADNLIKIWDFPKFEDI